MLYQQIVYCSVKMHDNYFTWCPLGTEGIIGEFLSQWRESHTVDRKQGFCITSPEIDFSDCTDKSTNCFNIIVWYYLKLQQQNVESLIFPVTIYFYYLTLPLYVNYHVLYPLSWQNKRSCINSIKKEFLYFFKKDHFSITKWKLYKVKYFSSNNILI